MSRQYRQMTSQQMKQIVDDWNDKHPVGTPVIVDRGNEDFHTRTRSGADILSGHTVVIWLEGISGCYALDRVRPA